MILPTPMKFLNDSTLWDPTCIVHGYVSCLWPHEIPMQIKPQGYKLYLSWVWFLTIILYDAPTQLGHTSVLSHCLGRTKASPPTVFVRTHWVRTMIDMLNHMLCGLTTVLALPPWLKPSALAVVAFLRLWSDYPAHSFQVNYSVHVCWLIQVAFLLNASER